MESDHRPTLASFPQWLNGYISAWRDISGVEAVRTGSGTNRDDGSLFETTVTIVLSAESALQKDAFHRPANWVT